MGEESKLQNKLKDAPFFEKGSLVKIRHGIVITNPGKEITGENCKYRYFDPSFNERIMEESSSYIINPKNQIYAVEETVFNDDKTFSAVLLKDFNENNKIPSIFLTPVIFKKRKLKI